MQSPSIPVFKAAPSLPAMSHYLTTMRQTLGRQTLFQGVWQLQPGETLTLQAGNIQINRYWDYPQSEQSLSGSESEKETAPWLLSFPAESDTSRSPSSNVPRYDECVDLLFNELEDSIRVRLASDVPVGMFLSGGVDSNSIAHLMKQVQGTPFATLCIDGSTPESINGDAEHAALCAEEIDCPLQVITVEANEYLESWETISEATSLPLTTPSDVLIYRLAQETKKQMGVVLGGEGADELLCGYSVQHWSGMEYDLLRSLQNDTWAYGGAAAQSFTQSLMRQYGRTNFESPVDHYFAQNSLIPTQAKSILFQETHWNALDSDRALWQQYLPFYSNDQTRSTAAGTSELLHRMNLESLLGRLDTSTMLASLEARVPFTDHLLVEKIWNTPREHRIDCISKRANPCLSAVELYQTGSLQSKRILRSGATRMMSDQLAMRPKASFPTPVPHWLGNEWREWASEKIKQSAFAAHFFQREAIQSLSDNSATVGMPLWSILNLVEWGDRQFAA